MPVVHDERDERDANHWNHVAGVAASLACNNLPDMNGAPGFGPRLIQQDERRE